MILALEFDRISRTRTEAQGLSWFSYLSLLPILGIDREIVSHSDRIVLDHGAAADHSCEMQRVVVMATP